MSLKQQTLSFTERKKSSKSVSKAKRENDVICSPRRQTRGSSTVKSNDGSVSHAEVPAQLQSPSKRRTRNHSEPPSPPKVKCENELTQSVNPATPSCKATIAPATPSSGVAPSPKTPSTFLSQLSLKSPALLTKEKHLPPKSLFSEPEDLLAKARNALHTHTVTDLPGREVEITKLKQFIDEHLEKETSGSLYISGPPGTGKTACLTHVMEQPDIMQRCRTVYLNCTAVGSPNIIYSKLAEQLKLNSSKTHPLETITKYLQGRHKTLLIVFDEMDQLGTRNQSILYTVFEWPAAFPKGIILVGISNALDLTDRMLPRLKAKLKLAPQLLHFAPYSREQLLAIFHYRLEKSGAVGVFMPSALQLLASKQAAVNGDARRALDTARRLVENEGCKMFVDKQSGTDNPQSSVESGVHPMVDIDDKAGSPHKSLRSSPRKPMTLVPTSASSQISDQEKLKSPHRALRSSPRKPMTPVPTCTSIQISDLSDPAELTSAPAKSLDKFSRSSSPESNISLKENASPPKVKSARKLNFLDTESNADNTKLNISQHTDPKPIDVKSVMAVYSDVYGTSQNLGRSGEELPFQHKLAVCSLLLILRKSRNKDVTLGKLHDVYRKVCSKRHITPLDQVAFLSMLELIEARGILHLQSKGKGGSGRLLRVCFQWVEDEVVAALRDRDLLASISNDVSCLS